MFQDHIDTLANLRIFVSSTFQDLQKHQTAVLNSINSLVSFTDDTLYWPKDEDYSSVNFTDRVKEADLLIIIIAHRYGYIPKDADSSFIENTYNTAAEHNVPILAFIVDDSYAWPPTFFDFEHREKLEKFKARIKKSHSFTTFSSPDNLASIITEAIVSFINKHTGIKLIKFPNYVSLKEISTQSEIPKIPDINIPLGRSEDQLFFIIDINRSNGLEDFFKELDIRKPNTKLEFPDIIFDELRVSLSERNRIYTVYKKNGETEDLFVSQKNLSQLFESLFFRIVSSCSLSSKKEKTRPQITAISQEKELEDVYLITNSTLIDQINKGKQVEEDEKLESVGGTNRFLGISLTSDNLYSVGKRSGKWVEWHPFILESLEANLPDVYFSPRKNVDNNIKPISSLEEYLTYHGMNNFSSNGQFIEEIDFYVARQSVGKLFFKIAQSVENYHKQKALVHGDIKPSNILLSSNGPIVIDGFDINEGEMAPGWTASWSAPEVIMGDPVSFKSDVYSLARIITDITGGYLLGEVRKIKIPKGNKNYDTEIDIFYNPIVQIHLQRQTLTKEGIIEWRKFLENCLRFDPNERVDMSKFLSTLNKLLGSYPLRNRIKFQLPNKIFAAILPNGNHVITRVIFDKFEHPKSANSQNIFKDSGDTQLPFGN